MELGKDTHFYEFINNLEKIGLKRVSINESTCIEKDNAKKQ